ncbi:zinc finger protein 462-like [Grus japonensis]|uniref:Zinc finger protein 462-like n=1 Tax=Grus japonensis TaxID=30415 RepID=A0ABC9W8P7_GRUJA
MGGSGQRDHLYRSDPKLASQQPCRNIDGDCGGLPFDDDDGDDDDDMSLSLLLETVLAGLRCRYRAITPLLQQDNPEPAETEPMPASSKTDPPLAKAKPISTSVIALLKREVPPATECDDKDDKDDKDNRRVVETFNLQNMPCRVTCHRVR